MYALNGLVYFDESSEFRPLCSICHDSAAFLSDQASISSREKGGGVRKKQKEEKEKKSLLYIVIKFAVFVCR